MMKMEELFVLIRKVMHFDLEESMLSDDFSSLGLSSLDRVNLLIEIEDHYHMVIDENNLPLIDFEHSLEAFMESVQTIVAKERGEESHENL